MICRFLLGLLFASTAFADVTINYTARVILGGSNPTALSDLLTTFGLTIATGPDGPEVRFPGTFTFDPSLLTNPNQIIGAGAQATSGLYNLAGFTLNGVALQPASAPLSAGTPSMTIGIGCCRTGVGQNDVYVVALSDTTPGGVDRYVSLQLELTLPRGTFASSALPVDVSFYSQAISYQGIPDFGYHVRSGATFLATGGDTVWTSATPNCPVKVNLFVGKNMNAYFKAPNSAIPPALATTLNAYAASCGFSYFNWQQTITTLPAGNNLVRPNNIQPLVASGNVVTFDSSDPRTCVDFWPGCSLVAPPSIFDPPKGGYTYQNTPPFDLDGTPYDPYPFYYPSNPPPGNSCGPCQVREIVSSDGTTLSFLDSPTTNGFIAFQTRLVGVSTQPTSGSVTCGPGDARYCATLYSWTWESTFNGTAGGIKQTSSAYPIDPGSGTGGVTITSINGAQLPPVVPSSQVTVTASGLAYSRVTQTFNGTMILKNISNSAINGPLQILFTGLPPSAVLTNATSSLSGTPYITAPVVSFAPGQSITVAVQLKNPSNIVIELGPTVYSGGIN